MPKVTTKIVLPISNSQYTKLVQARQGILRETADLYLAAQAWKVEQCAKPRVNLSGLQYIQDDLDTVRDALFVAANPYQMVNCSELHATLERLNQRITLYQKNHYNLEDRTTVITPAALNSLKTKIDAEYNLEIQSSLSDLNSYNNGLTHDINNVLEGALELGAITLMCSLVAGSVLVAPMIAIPGFALGYAAVTAIAELVIAAVALTAALIMSCFYETNLQAQVIGEPAMKNHEIKELLGEGSPKPGPADTAAPSAPSEAQKFWSADMQEASATPVAQAYLVNS